MNTALSRGGINFLAYDLATKSGPIANYDKQTGAIDTILAEWASAGLTCLGLPMLFWQNTPAALQNLYLDFTSLGQIATQHGKNLAGILASWRAMGGRRVLIAPQFYGAHDFRQWTAWDEGKYNQIWQLIAGSIRDIAAGSNLQVDYDLCPEWNQAGQAGLFGRRIWTDYTGYFWPNGVPCLDASISFVSDPTIISQLPSLFAGLAGGAPSGIGFYLPHAYGAGPGEGAQYGSAAAAWQSNGYLDYYGELVNIRYALAKAGLPERPWKIGECFSLTKPEHAIYAQKARLFVQTWHQVIESVYCFQIDPDTPEPPTVPDNNPCSCIPTNLDAWADNGF